MIPDVIDAFFDPFVIYRLLKATEKKSFEKRWNDAKHSIDKARQNPLLYEFLDFLYGGDYILKRDGKIYPLAVFSINKKQSKHPESIKGTLNQKIDVELTSEINKQGDSYMKILKRLKTPITNKRTFRLLDMQTKGKISLNCGLGWYEGTVSSSDVLEWEILTKFGQKNPTKEKFGEFLKQLKSRNSISSTYSEHLLSGNGMDRAIAISTLVVFRHRGGWATFVRERSPRNVAVHSDLLHVIPSFMFQPMVGQYSDEFNITHNIYREYLEEIFSKKEPREVNGETDPLYFFDDDDLKYLLKLIKTKKASLSLTGIAINLLNLRPEICSLLLIDTPDWYRNHSKGNKQKNLTKIKINEEFKSQTELAKDKKDILVKLDLGKKFTIPDTIELGSLTIDLKDPSKWVPPGIAALYLGVEKAKKIHQLQ